MFNKPTLFPKSSEAAPTSSVSAPRGGRLVPGTGAPGGVASANEGPSVSRESPLASASVTSVAAAALPATAADAKTAAASSDSHLIVGPNVKLKGAEILDCDTLVVEGTVEAKMDSRVIRIAEKGFFTGTVGIDVAEIHGRFEGELTARSQLIIHSTGRVSGKIRYGKIFIEEGGEISGDIKAVDASSVPASAPIGIHVVPASTPPAATAATSE